MILIGIGGNLPAPGRTSVLSSLTAALDALEEAGAVVRRRSSWYETQPVPPSGQPLFLNAVAELATGLGPGALLDLLLAVERRLGRERGVPNAARTVDLDLLAYDDRVVGRPGLVLPHPRLHERRFVLAPLAEIAADWRHPVTGRTAAEMLAALPPDGVRRLG